ncbi:MAG: 3-keto-5-aminohexanoate cleavage protein [Solirubrobacteraceae bacterium]|nr:3-keto-5-aminohexanoate cleavage protein [Solirubrobacteraceae bacterium]
MIKAALNGGRTKDEHAAIPVTVEELAREATAAAAAGAGAIHLHARDAFGAETIDPVVVNGVAAVVREACGLPVGVSSAPWIETDQEKRFGLIRGWSSPDFGSAMFNDPGAPDLMRLFLEIGLGCEAAVLTVDDVEAFAASGLADQALRVIVEPMTEDVDVARREISDMHAALDAHGIKIPRLVHGMGAACWPLAEDALRSGFDIRIGFEDVLVDPDGQPVSSNGDLVAAAAVWSV